MIDNMQIFQISKQQEELQYGEFIKGRITDKRDFEKVKRERLTMIRMVIDALQEEERILLASQTADDIGTNAFRPDILAKPRQSDKIVQLTKERDEAYQRIEKLEMSANKDFQDSREYRRMQEEIHNLQLGERIKIQHVESEIKSDMRLMRQIKQIRDDNVRLCKEHGTEYWEGIAQQDRYANRDIWEMEKENEDLKAKVKAQEVVLEYYKALLAGKDPDVPEHAPKGRPPISEDQKKRIRQCRRDGWTIKEIAEHEGCSIGVVSKICKGLTFPSAKTNGIRKKINI